MIEGEMRKCRSTVVLLAAVMLGSILAVAAPTTAVAADVFTISFLYEDSFAGVDPPTTNWSTNEPESLTVKEPVCDAFLRCDWSDGGSSVAWCRGVYQEGGEERKWR